MINAIQRFIRKFTLINGLLIGAILVSAATLFFELAEDVWLKEGFVWDAPLMLALHGMSRPWLDSLFIAITHTASIWVLLPLTITAVYLWSRSEKETAVLIIVSFVGAVILNSLLKVIFARPRPDIFPPLVVEQSYSFPSGHTMSAVAFYGLLSILLWQRGHHFWAVLSGIWVFLVALSRVYLGAHYPSDVLASLALGTIWLAAILLIFIMYQNSSYSS